MYEDNYCAKPSRWVILLLSSSHMQSFQTLYCRVAASVEARIVMPEDWKIRYYEFCLISVFTLIINLPEKRKKLHLLIVQ